MEGDRQHDHRRHADEEKRRRSAQKEHQARLLCELRRLERRKVVLKPGKLGGKGTGKKF